MPTDPSLEFDLFEVVRLRLAEALTRRDYDPLLAERIALRVVQGVRPASQFLKVLTRAEPPGGRRRRGAVVMRPRRHLHAIRG